MIHEQLNIDGPKLAYLGVVLEGLSEVVKEMPYYQAMIVYDSVADQLPAVLDSLVTVARGFTPPEEKDLRKITDTVCRVVEEKYSRSIRPLTTAQRDNLHLKVYEALGGKKRE
ncbi:MAG TPA: hypothetical protein VJB66_01745 [Candidatus Nanoarchaeia archaeon]|nr:hypothetical protein [Candidatus Nanoarchaeia archaeon]